MQWSGVRHKELSDPASAIEYGDPAEPNLALWRGLSRVDKSRMNVEFVHPTQLDVQDIVHLTRGCLKIRFQKVDPQHLVVLALSENLSFYKLWGTDFQGIVAVAPRNDTLWVEMVSGKGMLKHFDEIVDWLNSLAKSHGAHSVSGMIASPVLSKLWKRRGAKEVAHYFVQEVQNGRLT